MPKAAPWRQIPAEERNESPAPSCDGCGGPAMFDKIGATIGTGCELCVECVKELIFVWVEHTPSPPGRGVKAPPQGHEPEGAPS